MHDRAFGSGRPGFHPSLGHALMIELGLAVLVIAVAAVFLLREYRTIAYKAQFSEVLLAVTSARHAAAERVSLTGRWDYEPDTRDARPKAVMLAPDLSIKQAAKQLEEQGAVGFAGSQTRYVGGIFYLGSDYIALIDHPALPGAGVLAFRAAVPDVERPASVTLHCGSGRPPKGWVAADERVSSNLPPSRLPWFCRGAA